MRIDESLLTKLGVTRQRANRYLPALNRSLPAHGMDTPLRTVHFLAQVVHESARMARVEENLNYSEQALRRVFRRYFTPAQARDYARQPRRIGARVYADRLGNGDEESGEGYRYRGRGLIQLTGKRNYQRFSEWMEDDVVARPDLVASRYAVESAVYYWSENDLNALADLDDVKRVTRRINGGLNGLEDRLELLERAKRAIEADTSAPPLGVPTHQVKANRLNLRSRPRVAPGTLIGVLSQGAELIKLAYAEVPGWLRARGRLDGQPVEGFVAARFLTPIVAPRPAPAPEPVIPVAHLAENRRDITRARDGGRAYPLGEAGRPRRRATAAAAKARALLGIVAYLDSERPTHRRYAPKGGTTSDLLNSTNLR